MPKASLVERVDSMVQTAYVPPTSMPGIHLRAAPIGAAFPRLDRAIDAPGHMIGCMILKDQKNVIP